VSSAAALLSRRNVLRIAGGLLTPLGPLPDRLFAPVSHPVTFTDMAAEAGLAAAKNISGAPLKKQTLLEEIGCGVALFDYDNDGWLDIFLVNGSTFDTAPRARRPASYLFRNNRDGTFTDVTQNSGLTYCGWGQGCCVGDYDNDGFEDLFVTYWGRNVLYHNNGDGTFTNVSEKAGVAGLENRWGAGCCFLDYDRDGRLDLFVANYVNFDPARAPRPGQAAICRYNEIAAPCGPQGFAGGTNILYRNRGDGAFEDVSEKSGIANPRGATAAVFIERNWRPTGSYGMGAVAADFDNDGWPDIYVACDSAPSLLYHNNRDGTFREVAVPAGCAFDEDGAAMSGMGAAAADYDGDGWLDIVRTNFSDQVTTLYRNNGDGTFHDASLAAGLGINRKYLGFGVGFFDFDNDGWKDMFIANGHVYAQLASRKLHVSYKQRRILYRNLGDGRFEDVSARAGPGIMAEHVGRGCAFGDLDNDGDIDIVVNNLDAAPSLLRNDGGNRNNWLLVKCIGTRSNRSAIGARVRVTAGGRTQIDEVMSGSSYYSQNDLRLHFGLGAAPGADKIEVLWPSGLNESFTDAPANHLIVIEEGKSVFQKKPLRRAI
jgi:enediyne biosynthesis protein E4